MKNCARCKHSLPETDFGLRNGELREWCKPCTARAKAWAQKNRERKDDTYLSIRQLNTKILAEFLPPHSEPKTIALTSMSAEPGIMEVWRMWDVTIARIIRPAFEDWVYYYDLNYLSGILTDMSLQATTEIVEAPPKKLPERVFVTKHSKTPASTATLRNHFIYGGADAAKLSNQFKVPKPIVEILSTMGNWEPERQAVRADRTKKARELRERFKC